MPQTVFIVGAGASQEVNLPTGAKLTETIADMLDLRFDQWGSEQVSGDRQLVEALRQFTRGDDLNLYIHAGRRIREGMLVPFSLPRRLADRSRGS
jgi:hypothetical protein